MNKDIMLYAYIFVYINVSTYTYTMLTESKKCKKTKSTAKGCEMDPNNVIRAKFTSFIRAPLAGCHFSFSIFFSNACGK